MTLLRFVLWCVIVFVVGYTTDYFMAHDDTDPPGARSGLVLRTDARTGCQYVGNGALFGSSITPRLDRDGKPVCGATR